MGFGLGTLEQPENASARRKSGKIFKFISANVSPYPIHRQDDGRVCANDFYIRHPRCKLRHFQKCNCLKSKNTENGLRPGRADALRAVDGVSLAIGAGETVCSRRRERLCGKSVTALSLARLVGDAAGQLCRRGNFTERLGTPWKMSNGELRADSRRRAELRFSRPGRVLESGLPHRQPAVTAESLKLHKPEKVNDAEVIRPVETR